MHTKQYQVFRVLNFLKNKFLVNILGIWVGFLGLCLWGSSVGRGIVDYGMDKTTIPIAAGGWEWFY